MPKEKKEKSLPKTQRCPLCRKRVRAIAVRKHVLACAVLRLSEEELGDLKTRSRTTAFASFGPPLPPMTREEGQVALVQDGVYRSFAVYQGEAVEDPFRAGRKKYDLIFADPPWAYRRKSGRGIVPYSTMSFDEIWGLPVRNLASRDAVLVLCVVSPSAIDCLQTFKWWGFEMRTKLFDWIKTTSLGTPFLGCGCYSRPASEDAFVGTRGDGYKWFESHGVSQIIFAPRTKHSAKPREYFDKLAKLFGSNYEKMNKIELFARQTREGWDSWGNEIEIST